MVHLYFVHAVRPAPMFTVTPTEVQGHYLLQCTDSGFGIVYWNMLCESLREHPAVRCAAAKTSSATGKTVGLAEVQAPDLEGGVEAVRQLVREALASRAQQFADMLRSVESMSPTP